MNHRCAVAIGILVASGAVTSLGRADDDPNLDASVADGDEGEKGAVDDVAVDDVAVDDVAVDDAISTTDVAASSESGVVSGEAGASDAAKVTEAAAASSDLNLPDQGCSVAGPSSSASALAPFLGVCVVALLSRARRSSCVDA